MSRRNDASWYSERCDKRSYETRAEARAWERENRKLGRDHMAPYWCDEDRAWHLGHSKRLKQPVPMSRTTRIKARSAKRARVYREQRAPLVAELLALFPVCQIQWDENCTQRATTVHELLKRSRGGSIVQRSNCVTACVYCNGAVEDNPEEAHARGFALHSWEDSA